MLQVNINYHIPNRYEKLDYHFELNVAAASTTGIYGVSGAGKSTLLRLISGLEKPLSGNISFDEKIWFSSEKSIDLEPQNRNLSLMFPEKQLFTNMSVSQNIDYANHSDKNAQHWLTQFKLTHLAQRKPQHLSQGEHQRVAFIRALARRPQLLLLDEPFSAINEELKADYYQAIESYKKEWDMRVIMISHNRDELNKISQQQYHLTNGKLICDNKSLG